MTAAVQPDESGTDLRLAVAEEIRSWLGRRRISGAALARRLGKSQTWVARRLDGRQAFDVDDLQMIATELQVPVTEFFANAAAQLSDSRRYPTDSTGVVVEFPLVRALRPGLMSNCGERLDQKREHRTIA